MNNTLKTVLQSVGLGLLVAFLVVANTLCGYYFNLITIYFGGYGIDYSKLDYEQGNAVCQEIEREGIVLLKNEGNTLPLTDVENVAVFGWGSTDGGFIMSGAGSGSSEERGSDSDYRRTFLQGIAESGFKAYEPLTDMYKSYKSGRENGDYWNAAYPFFNLIEPPASEVAKHIQGARSWSSTAFVVISRLGGEGQDLPRTQRKWNMTEDTGRTYLQLTTEEEGMLDLVYSNFDTVVVIVNACNAMELGWLEDNHIDAAISVGAPGQSGTVAIGEVLRGKRTKEEGKESEPDVLVSPSGKTVDAYAYDLTTAATYANAPNCRTANASSGGERTYTNGGNYIDYAEGIYIGYKWYETADAAGFWQSQFANSKWGVSSYDDVVQYPFGYGLSYTKFTWNVVNVSPASGSTITADTEISIRVNVTNDGGYPGQDVVQVYYSPEYHNGGIEKAAVNLAAFAKTEVLDVDGDKSSQSLTLTFKAEDMKSYDYNDANRNGFSGYELESGTYTITLRTDSHTVAGCDGATITYRVADTEKLRKDSTTEYDVVNRFTGDAAADGISIDGTNTNANIPYMTRADFTGTFPTPRDQRAKDSKLLALSDNWLDSRKNTTNMPEQGQEGNLKFMLAGEASDNYQAAGKDDMNWDLIFRLGDPANWGKSFNDSMDWDHLLNQLTVSELNLLVQGGGYRTLRLESVAKPEITDLDGPSGLNDSNMTAADKKKAGWTSFPVETVMAQTWSAKQAYIYGLAVGKEAGDTSVGGWYAPAVNIHRSPFDGRNFEYYSEDPFLSGVMGAETTRGALDNGLYCYVKHFAVNETEFNRSGLYTWLTEQTLREIYLKPFEICVKEGNANAIMSSFNRIGATWAGGSYDLLTEVLRNEWGFKGSVVTDYSNGGTYMNPDQGLRAGNDIWLNGQRTNSLQNGGYNDKNSATAVSAARDAAKNVIYTYCNTMYLQNKHLNDPDANKQFVVELGNKAAGKATPYWVIGLVAIDLAAAGGIAVILVFMLRRLLGKNKPKAAAAAMAAADSGAADGASESAAGGETVKKSETEDDEEV